MKKNILMEKYPTYSLELDKNEVSFKNLKEIVKYFERKIDEHKIATHIASFDQYSNTKSLGGEINPEIVAANSIVFCFGSQLPNAKALAVKPRVFGICETKDKFFVEFLEAPRAEMNDTMEAWAKGLIEA